MASESSAEPKQWVGGNHQTHHRGQVTTLLSQSGVDVGLTDIIAFV